LPTDSITSAIDSWRETYGMSPASIDAGEQLRERLWSPLADRLADVRTVLISPDGALGRLPFAALPGKSEGTYLLDDYRLALAPVPQLIPALVAAPAKKQVERELLLLGDVDYDHRPGETPVEQNRRSR
jgi:CHAT domain-containing protein